MNADQNKTKQELIDELAQLRRQESDLRAAMAEQVAKRRQAEAAQRESEQRYRGATDEFPQILWRADDHRQTVECNRRWQEYTGQTLEEARGFGWIKVVHPDDVESVLERVTKAQATGEPYQAEYRVRRASDGSYRWNLTRVVPLKDHEGRITQWFGSVTDIDDLKRAEESLQKAHGELKQKVSQRTADLTRANELLQREIEERKRAEEALRKEHRTLKHLLQSSDHERQLIAYEIHDGLAQQLAGAIMQFQTYTYLKDAKPDEAAHAYDAAMTMLHQGHFEARRLISGVRPPILDESGVVEAIALLVHEEVRKKGPKIEFRSRVDFDRLAPILENAIYRIVEEGLANACRHSQSKRVQVELVQHGETLAIKIQDWGVGFDPEKTDEDRFGLEGIRERARLLGGSAVVDTEPGKGTRVTVELPLVPKE